MLQIKAISKQYVNTTRKHYAAIEEDRRRNARNVVKLRNNV